MTSVRIEPIVTSVHITQDDFLGAIYFRRSVYSACPLYLRTADVPLRRALGLLGPVPEPGPATASELSVPVDLVHYRAPTSGPEWESACVDLFLGKKGVR